MPSQATKTLWRGAVGVAPLKPEADAMLSDASERARGWWPAEADGLTH